MECKIERIAIFIIVNNDIFYLYLYRYPLGWHALPSHANAEACLTGWPLAQCVTPGKGLV